METCKKLQKLKLSCTAFLRQKRHKLINQWSIMNQKILAFKSNLPSLFVLEIYQNDLNSIMADIKSKKKTSPMMFAGLQVLVDLSEIDLTDSSLDLVALRKTLINEGILPIAIMTDNKSLQKEAVDAEFGVILPILRTNQATPRKSKFSRDNSSVNNELEDQNTSVNSAIDAENNNKISQANINKETDANQKSKSPVRKHSQLSQKHQTENQINKTTNSKTNSDNLNNEPKKTEIHDRPNVYLDNKIVNKNVRSGQRVYSKGDLTILGSVSAGAEVIADGNIHIYGALNGRAMAGALGNADACIFCKYMNAEIVAIAGQYCAFDDIETEYQNQSVVISLQGEQIVFSSL